MRRSINNLISIIICFAMLMSLILPINTTHALIKDENIIKLADNSTVDDYKNVLEDNNFGTRYSGRIWTDKSVYANNSDVSNITLDNKFNVQYDEDFLTVFSALGSSQLIQSKNTMDVLIVIDASGSMGEDVKDHLEHTDEKTRIAHTRMQMTLDSVNSLIDTVMELNPYNRIYIVAYGATAYYAIYYYIPSSNGTKGKLIKYAIAAKGADFYDANNNSYLTYYNVNSRREVEEKSNNTVVATKIGKKRTINLDKLTLNKKDNITNTAPDYFGSNYGNTGENIIVSYLGNNGVIKYKTKEYLPKEPEKPEEPEILENNPQTGFMISLNVLFILGIPLAIYIYSKRKRKLYKID